MAEAPEKNGLDRLLEAEDAEIVKLTESGEPLKDGGQPVDDLKTDGAPATDSEVKPAAEETKPPVEEPKPEEKRESRSPTWKQLKELDRQRKALEAENEKLRHELEEKSKPPVEEPLEAVGDLDDPIEKVREEFKEQLDETRAKVEQTSKQLQEKAIYDELVRTEQEFSKDHPDYFDALNYLIEQAKVEWTHDGSINRTAKELLQKNRAGVEEFAIANDFVDQDTGEPKLSEAAKEAAFRIRVHERRRQMVDNWRDEGLNVAKAAYDFAQARGFTSRRIAPQPEKKEEPVSRDRVIRAKESEAASSSLSAMQNRGEPRPSEITRREQILAMDPDEAEAYIAKRDLEDPGWFERLQR